mmetsp:Transcript_6477/g.16746  ORF Transcript_6477/g.16746 Transcript_6477/m.16746 type:complete len:220 (+) Transcript_6477:1680-2339(+)
MRSACTSLLAFMSAVSAPCFAAITSPRSTETRVRKAVIDESLTLWAAAATSAASSVRARSADHAADMSCSWHARSASCRLCVRTRRCTEALVDDAARRASSMAALALAAPFSPSLCRCGSTRSRTLTRSRDREDGQSLLCLPGSDVPCNDFAPACPSSAATPALTITILLCAEVRARAISLVLPLSLPLQVRTAGSSTGASPCPYSSAAFGKSSARASL